MGVTSSVLLVDDRAANLVALEAILEPLGARLVRAQSGKEALEHLLHEDFACVLLDIQLPEIDGFEIARLIKGRPSTQDLPILFVTATERAEADMTQGFLIGAADYLVKPLRAEVVRAKVKVFIDLHQRERRVREEEAALSQRARNETEALRSDFYGLLLQTPAAVCIRRGPQLVYEFTNPTYRQLIGRDVHGKPVRHALPELAGQGVFELLERVYATGESFVAEELPLRLADGHERLFRFIVQPLRDDTGKVTGLAEIAFEITEQVQARRRAEALADELARAEAQARLIADSVPEIIWTADATGKNEFHNGRWREYTGFDDVNDGWRKVVHPDDRSAIESSWAQSLRSGEPYQVEVRIRRAKDGTYRWHLARAIPHRNASGAIVRWIGSATDIDDQKRSAATMLFLAEAGALIASSLDSEATVRRLAEAAVPHLADWCIIDLLEEDKTAPRRVVVAHVDPAKVKWAEELGRRYPARADTDRGVPKVIRTGTAELYPEINDGMLIATARDEEHLRILRELGMRSVMVVPLRGRSMAFGAMSFVSAESGRRFDEADLRVAQQLADRAAQAIENARLYDEAQKAIRARDEFLSIASHELKTPLTPMFLRLDKVASSLEREPASPATAGMRKDFAVMQRQVRRLSELVTDLLEVSRLNDDLPAMTTEPVELAALVREVSERYLPEAERAGSELRVHAAGELVGNWNHRRLDQVVSNLLSNAIKYGAGKPIEVSVESAGEQVELKVRDQGIGIAPEAVSRIFGKFERAVSKRHYGGLGLGLFLVKQIIDALGGTVSVESIPGEGACFTVSLPRGAEAARTTAS